MASLIRRSFSDLLYIVVVANKLTYGAIIEITECLVIDLKCLPYNRKTGKFISRDESLKLMYENKPIKDIVFKFGDYYYEPMTADNPITSESKLLQ